ncbi:uncharacterized protein LOC132722058 [Ruditapes philippinarum]|uniref:uncharacterized protein LOC132722058 n=1 Tax=Ruditapes philippinarum TaxID=129788 RepID=UPI00295BE8C7|nr:uncharacterized protein LOC132722058 [Ruditapes philippinarum]
MDTYQHIESKEKLQKKFFILFDATYSKYRKGSFLYLQDVYEERLLTEMEAYLDMMKNEINKTCLEKGTKILPKMYDDMLWKNESRYITGETGYSYYEADMEQLKRGFSK